MQAQHSLVAVSCICVHVLNLPVYIYSLALLLLLVPASSEDLMPTSLSWSDNVILCDTHHILDSHAAKHVSHTLKRKRLRSMLSCAANLLYAHLLDALQTSFS